MPGAGRRATRTSLPRIARILVLAYLGYVGLLFAIQRRVVFPGSLEASTPSPRAGTEEVWLDTDAGTIPLWLLRAGPDSLPRPTLIFAHGNGESIDEWASLMERFVAAGMNVLLVEFPGIRRRDRHHDAHVHPHRLQPRLRLGRRAAGGGSRPHRHHGSLGGGRRRGVSRDRPEGRGPRAPVHLQLARRRRLARLPRARIPDPGSVRQS